MRCISLKALILGVLCASAPASATLSDCKNLYVLQINTYSSNASQGVVFAESPSATSGSYFTYLNTTTLSDRAYQQLSAMLLTAKATGRTVHVVTDGPGGCSISSNSYFIAQLELER